MMRILILAASLGLAVSQAAACDFMKTASEVDETKVASIDETQNMSSPVSQPAQSTDLIEEETVAPAQAE